MATIREYFDTDAKAMTVHADWSFADASGRVLGTIIAKIAMDFEANAKYWYFYIPSGVEPSPCLHAILSSPETSRCVLAPEGNGTTVETGLGGYSERQSSATLIFTQRTILYVDADLGVAGRRELVQLGAAAGLDLAIRDQEYARLRSEHEKPLAFISHDSRDKDDLVRELAHELIRIMCPVWYDEFSLKVGDSLRQKIEQGLREAKKCIVILSPNFLANGGWGKAEFDSIFTREILEQENVVLPVWHNVGVREVYEYSPRLADKVGLPTSMGIQELATRLCGAVKSSA